MSSVSTDNKVVPLFTSSFNQEISTAEAFYKGLSQLQPEISPIAGGSFLDLVRRFRSTGNWCHHAVEIADRIEELYHMRIDEGESEILMDSLQTLLIFLQLQPNIANPQISITPNGNIRAEWTKDQQHHFAIEFLPKSEAVFVVFSPMRNLKSRVSRVSGVSWIGEIIGNNLCYGLEWVFDEQNQRRQANSR